MNRQISLSRSFFVGSAFALALTPLVAMESAEAQLSFSGCGTAATSSFKVCASAEAWYENATGTLFFNVTNLNQSDPTNPSFADYSSPTGGWHTITAIGLENMVKDVDYSIGASGLALTLKHWNGSSFDDIDPVEWKVGSNALQIENTAGSTKGHKQGFVGGYDPSSQDHLQTTGGHFAQIAISGFSGFSFNENTLFEWRSQQVAFENCNDISANCATEDSAKGSLPPTNVVPEPISMVLLGSGLLGVGAARRRRRNAEVSDD